MKKNWELFESSSCQYLNELYEETGVSFEVEGGKDSSSSDINVLNNDAYLFSIEAKYSPSQSGQFVIIENNDSYLLSTKSKFENNKYTEAIIDYLNEHKEQFSPLGQKAIDIQIEKNILAAWIVEHYKRKNSYFIITSAEVTDYKAIIPIDDLKHYFEVSAVVRRKKSGTRHVAKTNVEKCIIELKEHLKGYELKVNEIIIEGNKTLAILNEDIVLKRSDRYFGETYFLSPNSTGEGYYIKQRSGTNNLNVIFSLVYSGPEMNYGVTKLNDFIHAQRIL